MSNATAVSLDDKYDLDGARALINGRQALVRLLLTQRRLDRRSNLKTAGFISGYRGSPLGGLDAELWKEKTALEAEGITFQPGLNEDLALTAIAGTQQIGFLPGRKVDGVFGLWYGKGPGVDRSGDAIKHANLAGVSPCGGVVLAFGDDHAGKSSTTAHQSDLTLASWDVPILYPSSVSEILEYGLAAFAMSRFSGALVGLKLVNETAEATGVVQFSDPPGFVLPDTAADEDVYIRPEVRAMQAQDARLVRRKLPRAQAFARANNLDRIRFGSTRPRFVIATAGKAFVDVLAALAALGISEDHARRLGIGVYKIALIFPLEPTALQALSETAEEIFFVEEKRAHAEVQARSLFYNHERRPRLTGKTDVDGATLLPADFPLDVATVAAHLAMRLEAALPEIRQAVVGFGEFADGRRETLPAHSPAPPVAVRRPAFCPGCPHNVSTKVPEGSFGATGIGCHGMVLFHADRNPIPMGHMGAEGVNWIGLSPYTETSHIFQNLGDGTYSHSGSLAIRAAVNAGVNITYKILFNDAVAMTGGQPVEGGLTVGRIVQQVGAEGVTRVIVVAEDPGRFAADPLPPGTELRHRDDMAAVQETMRAHTGVGVIIYDQVCAAEKRRRRKIDAFPDPDRRIFINAAVCEGCGDCSVQSNCLAVQPLETELGRKRRIDQSACNKDFSCVKGFCPSFVVVEGARVRKRASHSAPSLLSTPALRHIGDGFDMLIAGVGGTGVITASAIIGMAARIEGLGVSLYDMTGLSQKGGAVFSHIRLRAETDTTVPTRIGAGEADLILACDLIAAVQQESADTALPGRTCIVGNSDTAATADFQLKPDLQVPNQALRDKLAIMAGAAPSLLDATSLAERLLGDSIGANILLLGYAWQKGAIPLKLASIEEAIRLNERAAESNLRAFHAGRAIAEQAVAAPQAPPTLPEFIEARGEDLAAYWNRPYADRYLALLARVLEAATPIEGGEAFAWAVARSAYRLMAYKDEYEVARLYADGRFRTALDQEFESRRSLKILLAPPVFARLDPRTGRPKKISVGGWILPFFGVLARCKGLREGPLDIFGRSRERYLERELRNHFLGRVEQVSNNLAPETLLESIAWAEAPLQVRGFGHVKAPAAEALLERLQSEGGGAPKRNQSRPLSPKGV
nr:indolepyruvate ferredoxin oxidoreductase family protein [Brevundimonas naejangsanensis]